MAPSYKYCKKAELVGNIRHRAWVSRTYGRVKPYPAIGAGDIGKLVETTWLGKVESYSFYPQKWGYTWNFIVTLDDVLIVEKHPKVKV